MEREEILRKIDIFKELKDDQIKEIAKFFYIKEYKKGDYIFTEGDEEPGIYIVLEGIVKLEKETLEGKTVILRLATPYDIIGWPVLKDSKPTSTYTARALIDSKLLYISNSNFLKLLVMYPALAVRITCDISKRILEAYDRLKSLAVEKVEGRIATLLLELAEKIGKKEKDKVVINAPITRQDIAEMTGTTVETAIRIISRWKKEGIIDTERGKIEIYDIDYLKDIIS
ncbi:helix-turn-helix domain-containing protein [Venenivibrio stagnispumantis]|uniref:CRP/FNR family transcriptional regulator, anaerobic regulatory protein n=1 Tax=Venenivibrio stagnispumantis TaxID=407998 RepID=A0AA45WID6_9AQUI|nr:Crp/Fnr family transcriptional regulator [Venenivibrio stagnispumantis]MCW4572558.1 Crp/Fnr family transcriptional regulator [Venenivibrio stagnispumantis]SMP00350.1 CRP/FNR family transcriptional regulator, anaerobic regulatory protein [Venenivibrio stagnispumantis]